MSSLITSTPPEAFREEFLELLHRHMADEPADRLLATVAFVTGQIFAVQDMRRFTSQQMMDLVMENMQAGNRHAVEGFIAQHGGRN